MGFTDFLVECVFPTRCVSCHEPGEWWCRVCQEASPYLQTNLCACCASVEKGHDCTGASGLDGLVAVGFYHARPFREMLHAIKYQGVTRVMRALPSYAQVWTTVRHDPWPWENDAEVVIQALPAAENRVRQRGFDQAHLCAELFQRNVFLEMSRVDLLKRRKAATSQASLEHGAIRDANIRGAFSLVPGAPIPKNILLVDDVVTTGSSMREAARLLKENGAEKVYGLALAVGA